MKTTWNGLRIKPIHQIFGVDDIAAAMIIGTIASVATAAVSGTANTISQVKTNKQNQQNLETSWSRDDAQLQRARADASAAGFSPLAALSNNLTNTSPGMLQAPQFDSSGIVSSLQQGTRDYANYKAQKPILKQQEESMRLANKEKKIDLGTKRLQNLANLAKSMKELDGMDLSNYEKASILVASGIPSSTAQSMLKHTTKESVIKNTSQEALNRLQNAQAILATAQRGLVSAQTSTEKKQKLLVSAQTALTKIQKEAAENDNKYLNENIVTKGNYYTQPDLVKLNNGDYEIQYKRVEAKDDITRREYIQMLQSVIDQIKLHKDVAEINMNDWRKLGIIIGGLNGVH